MQNNRRGWWDCVQTFCTSERTVWKVFKKCATPKSRPGDLGSKSTAVKRGKQLLVELAAKERKTAAKPLVAQEA